MYFLDLFSGIGGFRLGMEQAGHKCAGYVEIDKFARKSYEAIHDTEGEWTAHDITTVTDESIRGLEGVDVICGGFPCQSFSVAGKRGGFNDIRGTLFFEIARFANILRPRYLFLENVTGLLNHDNGNTFETILGALEEIGYDAEWSCLNSKDFGVPQNRERVFIVGHLRGSSTRKIFPIKKTHSVITRKRAADFRHDEGLRIRGDGTSPCLCSSNNRLDLSSQVVIVDDNRFLMPIEAFRLQGFSSDNFKRASEVNNERQLYKQAGNSVTVNVIYEIAKRLW